MRRLNKKGMMILLSLILIGGIVAFWGIGLAQEPEEEGAEAPEAVAGTPWHLWNPLKHYITDPLQEAFPKLSIRGFIINESDLNLNRGGTYEHGLKHNHPWDRIEWLADLRYKYYFTDDFSLEGELSFLYDAAWDWQGSYRHYTVRDPFLGEVRLPTKKAEREMEYYHSWKRWFREAYIRWRPGNWELLLGKQQVRWGKAADVTTSALDAVHGYDWREGAAWFVPDDMEYRGQTVWMGNIGYHAPYIEGFGNLDLHFLIIPDYEMSNDIPYGYKDSVLTMFLPPSTAFLYNFYKTDKPSTAIENWEWGARIRLLTPNMYDIQLHYLYYWDRGYQGTATLFTRGINMAALTGLLTGTGTGAGLINVEPKPTRMHMIGMSIEKQYTLALDQNYIFRLEAAFFKDKYFSTWNELTIPAMLAGKDGVRKANYLQVLFNVETAIHPFNLIPGLYNWWAKNVTYPGAADWMVGFWYMTNQVFKYDNDCMCGIFVDVFQRSHPNNTNIFIGYISKMFAADRVSWSAAWANVFNGTNVYVTGLSYELTDALKVSGRVIATHGAFNDFWGLDGRLNEHFEIGFEYNF